MFLNIRTVTLAIFALFGSSLCSAQILNNGNFEAGLNGWEQQNCMALNNQWPGFHAPEGLICCNLGAGDLWGAAVWQTFTPPRPGAYVLEFDWLAVGDSGRIGTIQVKIADDAGESLASKFFSLQASNTNPHFVAHNSIRFVVPTGCSTATLSFSDRSPEWGIAVDPVLDSVLIRPISPAVDSSQPVVVYRSSECMRYSRLGNSRILRTQSYVLIDAASEQLAVISYGVLPQGGRYYTVFRPIGYTFAKQPDGVTRFSKIGPSDYGSPTYRVFRGKELPLAWRSRLSSLPKLFQGTVRNSTLAPDGVSLLVEGEITMIQGGLPDLSAGAWDLEPAIHRLTATLAGAGYRPVPPDPDPQLRPF